MEGRSAWTTSPSRRSSAISTGRAAISRWMATAWRDLAGVALPHEALLNFHRWHYDTFSMVHGHSLFEQDFYPIDWWKSVPVDPMFLHDNRIPVSDGYFFDAAGRFVPRSHFEFIRDHLGYRLELRSPGFRRASARAANWRRRSVWSTGAFPLRSTPGRSCWC